MERLIVTAENEQQALERATQVLKSGGLVVYPTETMYGAGVDATNSEAITKLLKFKARPAGKAISVLVKDQEMAETLVNLNDRAKVLYKTFLPGPVTLISKANKHVDDRLISEWSTLGIRISSYPFVQGLVATANTPITATSANASGKARPYSIERMLSGLSESQAALIDLILDAGELEHNEPSTVIDTTTEIQEIVRAGAQFTDLVEPQKTASAEETAQYAKELTTSIVKASPEKAVVFALEGEMGAGKTHFTKGIAEALNIKEPITSPSYTIQKEYYGNGLTLIHMDCWRLDKVDPELLGLSEYLKPKTILAIEWSHSLLPYFKENANSIIGYRIYIEHGMGDERTIRVESL